MASGSTFTTIDAPGAGTGTFMGTIVASIDAAGDVTGSYIDSNGAEHGFVLPAGGAITIFNVTGAGTGKGQGTDAARINSSGVIAGTYVDSNQANHGFVRAANGTVTTFDAPGAPTATKTRGTVVTNINDSGVIVGYYVTGISGSPSATHAFMRAANGTITNIDDPNAVTTGIIANNGTVPTSINDSGVIAGFYRDASLVSHGFVLSASGTFTNFDPPGVGSCASNATGGTTVIGIDPAGDVSGTYYDTNCAQHSYLRTASGAITTFTVSGAQTIPCPIKGTGNLICDTQAGGIGPAGDITGGYVDSKSVVHGFLRAVDTGNITSYDDPSAGTGASLQGTEGFSINAAGTIAGTYADSNGAFHGFLYTPALTATTTALSPAPAPNPSLFGEPVTLGATVSSSSGTPPNGENVTFMSGSTALGTGTLSSGAASLTTTALPAGTDSITAVYGGDSDFSGSTSPAVNQVVGKASSNTTLTSSPNPSSSGQSVTFTATVSGQFGGTVTGTITFSNGSTSLGSASLTGNSAGLTTTALPQGTDTITAAYSGDSNFAASTSSSLSQVVNALPANPAPVAGSISPAFTNAGGAAFTLTVSGTGFISGSTVYWGSSALVTTYVSATQLMASVPAADIVTAGTTAAITVQTPTPGGGTSNVLQFEVDSASASTTGPTFTSTSASVAAGSPASYPVTFPASVTSATVTCLNLPTGAACSYSSTTNTLTITTSATTPAGTYQVTVVFTETVSGAATAVILLPILLLPLLFLRRKLVGRGIWFTACLALALTAAAAFTIGCGGGSGGGSTTPPPTHQVTSAGSVTLTVH